MIEKSFFPKPIRRLKPIERPVEEAVRYGNEGKSSHSRYIWSSLIPIAPLHHRLFYVRHELKGKSQEGDLWENPCHFHNCPSREKMTSFQKYFQNINTAERNINNLQLGLIQVGFIRLQNAKKL